MCFSPLRRKTSELEGEECNKAKQSCGWNVPELRTTCQFGCRLSAIEGHQVDDFKCERNTRKKNIDEKVDDLNCQRILRKKTNEEIILFLH
jgi:hypothetical protein